MKYTRKRVDPKKLAVVIIALIAIIILILFLIFKLVVPAVSSVVNVKPAVTEVDKEYGKFKADKQDHLVMAKLTTDNEALNKLISEKTDNLLSKREKETKYILDYTSKLVFDTIAKIDYRLEKDDKEKTVVDTAKILFNVKTNKELKYEDIFRNNPFLITDKYPNVNVDELDKTQLDIDSQFVTVGTKEKQLKVEIDKNPQLFKSGNGIPSLYNKEPIERKTFKFDTSKKLIAFTYDDGPRNENHVKIRDVFNQYNKIATFYVIGELADTNADMIFDTYKDGHDIGNHTYTHPGLVNRNLTTLSKEEVREEYEKTNDAIFKAIGVDPETTRPPGGFYDAKTETYTTMKQVLWTVDSEDWRYKNDTERVYQNVRQAIHPNAIVLFHDLYNSSYEATKRLVPELIAEGYEFVDVATILEKTGN